MATTAPAPAATSRGNGLATAGMICGILGILLCWVPLLGLVLAVLGVVFGGIGMARAGRLGRGRGAAITGLATGILGLVLLPIMAAVAIPAFLEYSHKAKRSAAELALRRIETRVKAYYIEHGELPPSTSTMPGPPGSGCFEPGHKIAPRPRSAWDDDPGWRALGFSIDEPSLFSYAWTRDPGNRGHAEALGDLDCDGEISTRRIDVEIVDGNPVVTRTPATPD